MTGLTVAQFDVLYADLRAPYIAAEQQRMPNERALRGRFRGRFGPVGCVGRYIGLARTRLGHLLTAAALNFLRLVEWFTGSSPATTRRSPFATLMTDLIAA